MSNNIRIKNPRTAPLHWLYFRAIDRVNLRHFKKRTDREPRVKYPLGWWDHDHDRLMVGSYCVHHGIQEFKEIDNLKKPYKYDSNQRIKVIDDLLRDHFKIEHTTLNFTYHDRQGNINHNESNPIPSDTDYNGYLSRLSSCKKENKTLGKGVFLYVIHTHNFEYFSVINFTNSQFILGNKKIERAYERNSLHSYLESVGELIEPCFNEVLLFMLEAYIRGDFEKLYEYLTSDSDCKHITLEDYERDITDVMDRIGYVGSLWLAIADVMEWLLKSIHFDTILEEARGQTRKPRNLEKPSYLNLVDLTQKGEIFDYLAEKIKERYDKYNSRSRAI